MHRIGFHLDGVTKTRIDGLWRHNGSFFRRFEAKASHSTHRNRLWRCRLLMSPTNISMHHHHSINALSNRILSLTSDSQLRRRHASQHPHLATFHSLHTAYELLYPTGHWSLPSKLPNAFEQNRHGIHRKTRRATHYRRARRRICQTLLVATRLIDRLIHHRRSSCATRLLAHANCSVLGRGRPTSLPSRFTYPRHAWWLRPLPGFLLLPVQLVVCSIHRSRAQ